MSSRQEKEGISEKRILDTIERGRLEGEARTGGGTEIRVQVSDSQD